MAQLTANKVRVYQRPRPDGTQRTMVCINDTVHVSTKQTEGLGFHNPQSIVGNELNVEFYKKDEKMFNGQACTDDNKIVKTIEIKLGEFDQKMAKAHNAGFRAVTVN